MAGPSPAGRGGAGPPSRGGVHHPNDTFLLRLRGQPHASQVHQEPRVQQPVAVVVAHCTGGEPSLALRARLPGPLPGPAAPWRPTPLILQSSACSCAGLDARTTRCCRSLQVRSGLGGRGRVSRAPPVGAGRWAGPQVTYLASRASAIMPAARGAEAEVPVCLSVHWWCRSVVTWGQTDLEPRARPRRGLVWKVLGAKSTKC